MILTVDIGNSRIKWAAWEADRIVSRGAGAYGDLNFERLCDELFATVKQPSCVYALCVAGDSKRQAFTSWVKRHWQREAAFLTTGKQYKNIVNAYTDPSRHGVDRWAATVAGYQDDPEVPVCVISAGTAITFDLVEQTGQHLGGYILPSYTTMHKCLLSNTANLDTVLPELTVHADALRYIPDNTKDAINQGLHLLLIAGVREICAMAGKRLGKSMKILITGGLAESIIAYPGLPVMHHRPDLVMQGLYSIMTQR